MTKYLLTSTTTTASKRVGRVGMRVLVGVRQRVGVGNAQLLRASSGFLRFRSFSSSSSSSSSASNSSSSSSASASASSSSSSIWDIYNDTVHGKAISELPEVQASNRIKEFLTDKINSTKSTTSNNSNENSNKNNIEELLSNKYKYIPSQNDYLTSLKSIMMTYILNKNARIAALVGKGYYTIGPCGEENLSIIGCLLRDNNSNNNETNTDVDAYADADVDSNNLKDSNVGLILGDSSALHYRHTSISLTRQLKEKLWKQQLNNNDNSKHSGNDENEHNNENNDNNNSKVLKELLLGRARGYTVSKYDPVTGGVHCSIGSGSSSGSSSGNSNSNSNSTNEYVVSSTLASQCPSAIGRALGYSLLPKKKKKSNSKQKNSSSNQSTSNPISFVTLGDGSIHNSHFLSSVTLAKHARHNNIKCPIVFGISDNGLSISYKTNNFISQDGMFNENNNNTTTTKNNKLLLLPVFHVNDSNDMIEIYSITKQAFDYSRKKHAPTLIVYKNIVRRFGHASTDRQYEYLTSNEIHSMSKLGISSSSDSNSNDNSNSNSDNEKNNNYCNVIQSMIQAVDILEYTTYEEILNDWNLIEKETNIAFKQAMSEPKVSLQDMMNNRVSAPLTPIIPIIPVPKIKPVIVTAVKKVKKKKKKIKKEVMRKHMTRVIEEIMEEDEYVVYIGEGT
jgi:2-oxoisovalerate dehydrogenase E1 component